MTRRDAIKLPAALAIPAVFPRAVDGAPPLSTEGATIAEAASRAAVATAWTYGRYTIHLGAVGGSMLRDRPKARSYAATIEFVGEPEHGPAGVPG